MAAWKIAQAYAERADLDRERAFARLFVVPGEAQQGTLAHRSATVAPAGESVRDLDMPVPVGHPYQQESSAVHSTALKQTAILRLDAESAALLDALMEDEDRSS